MNKSKIVATFLALVLVVNMVAYALGRASNLTFWVVLGMIAAFAWKGIPWLKSLEN